jgi:hypothetical protein
MENYSMKLTEKSLRYILIFQIILFVGAHNSSFALSVFPGAQGFGTETRAAYGTPNKPIICIVTTIAGGSIGPNDSVRNGVKVKTGSLKALINFNPKVVKDGDRGKIILFEISGTIPINDYLEVDYPYTAIYGQTAPSPGITLKGCTLVILTHDVIIQHLRIRPGDLDGAKPDNRDAIAISDGPNGDTYNIVIDHCSVSWSIDENLQIFDNIYQNRVYNVTVSNTLISEALNFSLHSKGRHGMGLLVRGQNISILRNLLVHNQGRNPLISSGSSIHVINNGIYNAHAENIHPVDSGKAPILGSFIGNYAIPGKNSHRYANWAIEIEKPSMLNTSRFFVDDNYCKNYNTEDPLSCVRNLTEISEDSLFTSTPPVPISGIKIRRSKEIKEYLLNNVGARPNDRDSVDIRILKDFENSTGEWINSQKEVGGWPLLKSTNRKLSLPLNPARDDNNDGYSNLEEWIFGFSRIFDNEPQNKITPPFLKSVKLSEKP